MVTLFRIFFTLSPGWTYDWIDEEGDIVHSPISLLPDEVLVRIFQHLPPSDIFEVAQVCQTWRSISYMPCFWKSHLYELGIIEMREDPLTPCTIKDIFRDPDHFKLLWSLLYVKKTGSAFIMDTPAFLLFSTVESTPK